MVVSEVLFISYKVGKVVISMMASRRGVLVVPEVLYIILFVTKLV